MSYKGLVFAAVALAVSAAPAAAHGDHYYSGYDYASRSWNSGYSSVRPSFWGWPALYLPGQPKVIATADEIERTQAYEEWYGYRPDYDPYYNGLSLTGLPGALTSTAADALEDAARGAGNSEPPYDSPDYYDGRPSYRPAGYNYSYDAPDYDRGQRYDPGNYDEPRYGYGWREHRRWSHVPGWSNYRKADYGSEHGGADYSSGWGD
jgi:hypothetical protein